MVTAGATQGLHLISTVMFDKSTPVFMEDPSYFIALKMLKEDLGMNIIPGRMQFNELVNAQVTLKWQLSSLLTYVVLACFQTCFSKKKKKKILGKCVKETVTKVFMKPECQYVPTTHKRSRNVVRHTDVEMMLSKC